MNAVDTDLMARAVERECSLVQFNEDHEEKNERLDAMMLKEAAAGRKRIKRFKAAEAEELALIAEERKRLDERERAVKDGTAEKIAAENRRIAQAKAYIAAGA